MSEHKLTAQFEFSETGYLKAILLNAENEKDQATLERAFGPVCAPAARRVDKTTFRRLGEETIMFVQNRKFKRDYDRLFKKDPAAANVLLLLAELADGKGQVIFDTPAPEEEIQRLLAARFSDPRAYQLPGGPKR